MNKTLTSLAMVLILAGAVCPVQATSNYTQALFDLNNAANGNDSYTNP